MGSRSGWRRIQLALNSANLAVSIALVGGGVWASHAGGRSGAPAAVLRLYSPMLGALRWYDSRPVGVRALAVLFGALGVVVVLGCVLFSFKVHAEEIAVILLGIPFYLLMACTCLLAAGLAVYLIELLWSNVVAVIGLV